MAAKWRRINVEIPSDLKPRERQLVAEEIIEFIQERTSDGFDKRNKPLSRKPYTAAYAKRKGVSPGSVDLVLSGDMLGDIELLSHKRGNLLIGFKNGTESNAKADGNITGSYGRPSGDKKKARDFLGIFKKDVKALIDAIDFEDS